MIVLLAVLFAAAPDPLEAASAALARGNATEAEALAMAAAQPPHEGAALFLAGVARFRAGKPAEALEALSRARAAADPPPAGALRFNEASCLYELGRFADAEGAYEESARLDPELAPLALVNAGFAALDGGARDRARVLAAQARGAARGNANDLVGDLESHLARDDDARAAADYRDGLGAFDAGRFGEAREKFSRAAELSPRDGRARIMSGAAALRLGRLPEARHELESALQLPLDAADARAAREYLAAAGGRGWSGLLRLEAGYDDDALQSGWQTPNELPSGGGARTPSAVAGASLGLELRLRPADHLVGAVGYGFDHLGYLASAASDRSLQLHTVAAGFELSPREDLRLGASARGQLAFTGASRFRGLQAAGGLGLSAALDEGARTTTSAALEWTHKTGLSEFGYLGGERLDFTAVQELRLPFATLELGARARGELIGTAQLTPSQDACTQRCPAALLQAAFGYVGPTLWLGARTLLWQRLRLEGSLGAEWRHYLDDDVVGTRRADGSTLEVDRTRRQDQRFFVSATAAWSLLQDLSLTLRYDFVANDSNLESSARPVDPEGRTYVKNVVTFGTTFAF